MASAVFDMSPQLFVPVLRLLPGGEFCGLQTVNPLRDAYEECGRGPEASVSTSLVLELAPCVLLCLCLFYVYS